MHHFAWAISTYLFYMNDIYTYLTANGITYQKYDHPAVFSVAEAAEKAPNIPGGHTKNLFLRNRKGDKHFLVVIDAYKQADLKKLGELLGEKLGFASPERLMHYLGVTPGSVTLLGLINDTNSEVVVIIDSQLLEQHTIQCHPLTNTATLSIPQEDIKKFLALRGNEVKKLLL